MPMKRIAALLLALAMTLTLLGCGQVRDTTPGNTAHDGEPVTVTDMIGRQVAVTPGSYRRVVCIGAGALRMYSYIGDTALLCGVEDIDKDGDITLSCDEESLDAADALNRLDEDDDIDVVAEDEVSENDVVYYAVIDGNAYT